MVEETSHSRPYTVGVSIAVVFIFLIAIFHVWRYFFKKIRKWLKSNQPEEVIIEVPSPNNGGERKLSSTCVQQLEMILKYSDEPEGIEVVHKQKRTLSLNSGSGGKIPIDSRRQQKRFQSFTHAPSNNEICFLAGFSHLHKINE